MRHKSNTPETSSERLVRDIRRATLKRYSAEEKIRIVLDGLTLEVFDFAGGCGPRRVAGEAALAGFEEFLRPAVVQALGDAFAAAEFSDGDFAAQAIKDDADFIFG